MLTIRHGKIDKMNKIRKKTELITEYIIENIENNQKDLVSNVTNKFNISRQAVSRRIAKLIEQNIIIHEKGSRKYKLYLKEEFSQSFVITKDIQEDVIWRSYIRSHIGNIPENAVNIWQHGFSEIFNNVIDHSESTEAYVSIKKTIYSIEMIITDKGIGIFNKIKQKMNLLDERHAVLELTKGKLTTDPISHSGEGIFFTSRVFDTFCILSGGVFLMHTNNEDGDWILETQENSIGTLVQMKLRNNTNRTLKEVFDKFSPPESYGFTKTIVPVKLAQYGDEKLVSRSQAKRLLERVDRFKTVILDFTGVETIGQAFADQVFRVFASEHPQIQILEIRANEEVKQMINRVTSNISSEQVELF